MQLIKVNIRCPLLAVNNKATIENNVNTIYFFPLFFRNFENKYIVEKLRYIPFIL